MENMNALKKRLSLAYLGIRQEIRRSNLNSLAFELFVLQQCFVHETGFPRCEIFMFFFIDGRKSFSAKRDQKLDQHSTSFQSSPKINSMIITILICIQWKFTQPHHEIFFVFVFFNLWSIHLFQNNKLFQGIEFVDRHVLEKLCLFRINLPCMAFVTPRYLSQFPRSSLRTTGTMTPFRGLHTKKK